jgi:hypothetical protein
MLDNVDFRRSGWLVEGLSEGNVALRWVDTGDCWREPLGGRVSALVLALRSLKAVWVWVECISWSYVVSLGEAVKMNTESSMSCSWIQRVVMVAGNVHMQPSYLYYGEDKAMALARRESMDREAVQRSKRKTGTPTAEHKREREGQATSGKLQRHHYQVFQTQHSDVTL